MKNSLLSSYLLASPSDPPHVECILEAFDSSGGLNPVPKIQVIEDHSVQQRQQLQQQQQQQTQTGNSTTGNWTAGPDKQQWMLTRCDTVESKSSNSSSVNTDFLTEDQREVVRGWLGPGQLLLMNDELKTERGGDLPDDSLVAGEIYLILRKIAGESNLQVTVKQCRNLLPVLSQSATYSANCAFCTAINFFPRR
ncbi:hypothetical protein BOX15_Mlig009117g3 [Macrostomum lignano]|uniref:Uncharacterized protein n=1 Tax=Macrostomum lignano TaxID=282301 RepID=A0A267FWC3_9PLAT|nr:hypothetical protein BOX15_Mlig009117g3 [Macrostomum lignano]